MVNIVNGMSAVDFLAAINANNTSLLASWDCKASTFRAVDNTLAGDDFADKMNGNLRNDLFSCGMTGKELMSSLNASYAKKGVRRFQDYRYEHIASNTGRVEPTALPTDDGGRLDLLGSYFYTYSTDGVTFATTCNVTFDEGDYTNIYCLNFFRHNGKVYCTTTGLLDGDFVGILLWEEDAGTVWGSTTVAKNFTNPTIIYPLIGGGVSVFGNTFVFCDNDTWYMLVEAAGGLYSGMGFQIYLASCATFNGTYVDVQSEAVVMDLVGGEGVGNPEIVMNGNLPYKCDGKYYMYYHFHNAGLDRALYRAYSYDLITWTVEGPLVDCRIPPYRTLWTNGDQCVCEFKGRSYLFYSNNCNQYLDNDPPANPAIGEDAHIDMCIDFRPMSEMLRLRP